MGTNWAEFQAVCAKCGGDGKYLEPHNTQNPPPAEVDCPQCSGEGYIAIGRVKIKAIMDILEAP